MRFDLLKYGVKGDCLTWNLYGEGIDDVGNENSGHEVHDSSTEDNDDGMINMLRYACGAIRMGLMDQANENYDDG